MCYSCARGSQLRWRFERKMLWRRSGKQPDPGTFRYRGLLYALFIIVITIVIAIILFYPNYYFINLLNVWHVFLISYQMAKELRPGTVRALFGVDLIRNALHCTDLDSDGIAECEYCFRIL